jgi:hypothetical protein
LRVRSNNPFTVGDTSFYFFLSLFVWKKESNENMVASRYELDLTTAPESERITGSEKLKWDNEIRKPALCPFSFHFLSDFLSTKAT